MMPISLEDRLTNCINAIDVLLKKQDGITMSVTLGRIRAVLIDARKALGTPVEELSHD